MSISDVNFYAAWEPVRINAGEGDLADQDGQFFINATGLQWSDNNSFKGWLGECFSWNPFTFYPLPSTFILFSSWGRVTSFFLQWSWADGRYSVRLVARRAAAVHEVGFLRHPEPVQLCGCAAGARVPLIDHCIQHMGAR